MGGLRRLITTPAELALLSSQWSSTVQNEELPQLRSPASPAPIRLSRRPGAKSDAKQASQTAVEAPPGRPLAAPAPLETEWRLGELNQDALDWGRQA